VGDIPNDTAPTQSPETGRSAALANGKVRIGAIVAVAVAAGLLVWLLTRGDDKPKAAGGPTAGQVLPGIPAGTHV